MEITRKQFNPGVVVLELKGPLQMGVECKRLELAMDDLLKEKQTRIVFDLSQLTKIDSDGVGRVVKCLSCLRMVGGTLHLAGVTGVVGTALKLTHVDRLVKIFPTAREASQSLSATPPPSPAAPGH